MRHLPIILAVTAVSAVAAAQQGPRRAEGRRQQAPAQVAEEQIDPTKLAKLTGKVIHAQNGQPLRKVNLTLVRTGGTQNRDPAATTSDPEGKFTFDRVVPGSYRLMAMRPGFVNAAYGSNSGIWGGGGATITLTEKQEMDVEFKLVPQGVITGRVVDEDGEPLQNVQVMAMRATRMARRRPSPGGGGQTNDLGEFRLFSLAAGRYYVMAQRPRGMFGWGGATNASRSGGPEMEYTATYFPGVFDPASASVIEVKPGAEVSGIQIALRKSEAFRVKGRVLSAGTGEPRNMRVFLSKRNDSGGMFWMGGSSAMVRPDGSFELSGVHAGSYTLHAARMDGRMQLTGRANLDVTADMTDVTVQLNEPIVITGTVRIEGQEKPDFKSGHLTLRPSEGMSYGPGGADAAVKDDGTFKLENVGHDKYFVTALGFPEETYVRTVRLGDREVTSELDLTTAPTALAMEVILSPKAAVVEGIVRRKEQPLQGAMVTLVPDPPVPSKSHLTKVATTDQNGGYSLKGVAPGNYRAFAWSEGIPNPQEFDEEFLKEFLGDSVKLAIRESGRERAELKVIEADAEKREQNQ